MNQSDTSRIRRVPTRRYPSEAELRADVESSLQTYFEIEHEVTVYSPLGKRMRLDAVYTPRDPIGWHDNKPVFAVEYKQPPENFDTRDYTRWIAQAVSYTYATRDGHRLPLFVCPSPIQRLTTGTIYGSEAGSLVARILGQLKIGELVRVVDRGWSLVLNEHVMWSERNGIEEAARWSLAPKDGSR